MITKLNELNNECNKIVNYIEQLQLKYNKLNKKTDIIKMRKLISMQVYSKKELDKKRIIYRELKAISIEIGIDL